MKSVRSAESGVRSGRPILALLILICLGGSAGAQNGVPADGTEILRGLLKYHGFTPVDSLGRDAKSTLVVVVGRPIFPNGVSEQMPRHLAAGGGLLVLSNDSFDLRPLCPRVDELLPNGRVTGLKIENRNEQLCFRGEASSPLPVLAAGDPTMIRMGKRGARVVLATREPSTVTTLPNSYLAVEVAHHPPGSRYAAGGGVRNETPLAVMSDPASPGTCMVYADRAMFHNEFMVATEADGSRTDNFLYTFLVVRHLTERMKANGGPLECLFIEDGRSQMDFDRVGFVERPEMKLPPGVPPVLPPLPVLLDFALDKGNEIVAQAEERDLPNLIQQRDSDNRIQQAVLTFLAIFGSILLLRYLLARGWGSRHAPELVPRLRIDPDRGGVIAERRYSLLESGNLYEPMRDHLRFVFRQWGATDPNRRNLPDIAVDRPGRPRHRIVLDLSRLWALAYHPERSVVTPDDLEDLEEMITELSQAHETGIWRFVGTGGTA